MKTILGILLGSLLWIMTAGAADSSQSLVRVLAIQGVINPLSARYLQREVTQAIQESAPAIIIELNTPGGLESSMREITQTLLNAPIPIVVYVAPHGARAASAGMFITIAAHVAAMAPGTSIGAAHPVTIGGGKAEQKSDDVMEEKLVSDAAALARSIAKERNRNITWVEEAVRKSASLAAHEALTAKVIDLIATDLDDLLGKLDGRKIELPSGPVFLHTKGTPLVQRPMRLPERIMHTITDPNIAYLLISIGSLGVIAELFSPGFYLPGVLGTISLLLGFTALGSLPISSGGLILIFGGIALFLLELHQPGMGVFGVAGVLAFILGSLLLYNPLAPVSPALPQVRVSPWLVTGMTICFTLFVWFIVGAVIRAKRLPVSTGASALIGKSALAVTDLSPKGFVRLDHESWSAMIEPPTPTSTIRTGEVVEVVGLEGAILKVRKK